MQDLFAQLQNTHPWIFNVALSGIGVLLLSGLIKGGIWLFNKITKSTASVSQKQASGSNSTNIQVGKNYYGNKRK